MWIHKRLFRISSVKRVRNNDESIRAGIRREFLDYENPKAHEISQIQEVQLISTQSKNNLIQHFTYGEKHSNVHTILDIEIFCPHIRGDEYGF